MSDPFFHYTHVDDESDRGSFSFAGAEPKRRCHVQERPSYLQPAYQASHTPSSVCLEPGRNAPPPNNWTAGSPIFTLRSATATQFDSSPFALPPTLRAAPIPLYSSGSSLPHISYGASHRVHPPNPERDPHTVAMPILIAHTKYGGGLTEAHTYHYDLPLGFPQDDYMVEYPRAIPSPFISMPTFPTPLGTGPSHIDLALPSDPALLRSPRHLNTTFQHLPLSGSTTNPGSSGSFDFKSYSSPSTLSMGDHALAVSPSDISDAIQPQPYMTTSVGQLYTLTVPLEAVEFPPVSGAGEGPFFQCRWADCVIWITSEKEAVKNHLTHTHDVVLKGQSTDSACCEWVDCSSSLQRNGLVRHFHTHLGLKWLCSVCKGAYTRQDSVGFHTRREPRCQLAHAISHPSAVAYSAKINGDDTVTLTKVLQP